MGIQGSYCIALDVISLLGKISENNYIEKQLFRQSIYVYGVQYADYQMTLCYVILHHAQVSDAEV